METRSGANPEDVSTNSEPDEEQMDSEDKLSAEESDIEGMEVIAEDGENVKDEDGESLEEEETNSPEERSNLSEQGEEEVKSMEAEKVEKEKEEEVKHAEADEGEKLVKEEKMMREQEEPADLQEDKEVDFPLDLEACITLDEVDCDDEGGPAGSDGSKVFMEMSTAAEILRAEEECGSNPILSASSCTRSGRLNEHMTSDLDQIGSRSRERNESIKRDETPEKVPGLSDDQELRMDPEEELVLRKTPKKASTFGKCLKTRTGRRERTPEENPVPQKVQETKPEGGRRSNHDHPEELSSDRQHQSAGVFLENQLQREPAEQDPETDQQPEPPRPEPAKPVGAEFVRPVVGYFCNLCQLIFSDEDEAKLQHCSTLEHHRKYQEKMGWSFK